MQFHNRDLIMKTNNQGLGSETQKPVPVAAEVVQISLTMPQQLLDGIDALAQRRYISRAALIKSVLSQAIEVA